MTNKKLIAVLQGAISALKHGRKATARKKVAEAYAELWPEHTNPHDRNEHDASCNGMSPCDMVTEMEEEDV